MRTETRSRRRVVVAGLIGLVLLPVACLGAYLCCGKSWLDWSIWQYALFCHRPLSARFPTSLTLAELDRDRDGRLDAREPRVILGEDVQDCELSLFRYVEFDELFVDQVAYFDRSGTLVAAYEWTDEASFCDGYSGVWYGPLIACKLR